MAKVREHCAREHDDLGLRAAKAVALLELIAEHIVATTVERYDRRSPRSRRQPRRG